MEQTGEKWANLPLCLGGQLNILRFLLLLFTASFFFLPSMLSVPVPVWARLARLTLGSPSQMLPRGKQKHLSPAQPWLSPSDKSWGVLCQCCPVCHLSPFYTISPTVHTHFTLFALVRLHPDSVTEAGGSHPFLPSGLLCTRPRPAHLMQWARRVVASSKYQRRDPCRLFCSGPRKLKSL